jgi:hypothetical protein
MLDVPEWRAQVREDWARESMSIASVADRRQSRALMQRWLDAFDTVPDWMRDAIETTPSLLTTHFTDAARWVLHRAAPTSHGWKVLAGRRHEEGAQMLVPEGFGNQLDQAIETLEAAMSEEPNAARRVALARWLGEIAG